MVGLAGCTEEPVYHSSFFAFGTLVELTVRSADRERIQQAEALLVREFEAMHQALTLHEDSPLLRLNQVLETGESVVAEPLVLELIRISRPYYESSGGLFNPALGRLVREWGFHEEDGGAVPAPERLQAYVTDPPGMEHLRVEGARVHSTHAALWLDFGGIAKGYALEQLVDRLREMGLQQLILNAGGDLRVLGRNGARAWCVGIRDPREAGQVIASVAVEDGESVFTSGDYERYFMHEGVRYHHILDPETARPATGVASVTVIHREATLADAAATAIFVAGVEGWQRISAALGVEQVMLVDEQGEMHATPAMRARLLRGVCEGALQ